MEIEHSVFVKSNVFEQITWPLGRRLFRQDWRAPIRQYVQAMPRAFIEMELEAAGAPCDTKLSNPDLRTILLAAIFKDAASLRAFTEAHPIAPDVAEAQECWSVSMSLAEQLKARGEAVERIGDLMVWGRCATDLPVDQDPVIQLIRRTYVNT